ncbi:MAG: hypothetical protein ACE14V_06445 [bacterium]
MQCRKCEVEIQEGYKFCPNCGKSTKLPEPASQRSKYVVAFGIVNIVCVALIYVAMKNWSDPIGLLLIYLIATPLAFILGIIELIRCIIKKKYSTSFYIAILGIVITIFANIFLWVVMPKILRKGAFNSRAKGDQNMLATGLEAYFIDFNCYPAPGRPSFRGSGTYRGDGSFAEDGGIIPVCLTTPVAYITTLPHDPYKLDRRGYYGYGGGPGQNNAAGRPVIDNPKIDSSGIQPKSGWIVTSYGPDKVDGNLSIQGGQMLREELCWSDSYSMGVPDYMQCDTTYPLLTSGLTYDPTNGTVSPGDIWRRGP